MLGLFDQLGPAEIIIILAVFLLLFGAKKLPDLARSLGRSSTEFRKGLKEGGNDAEESQNETKNAPAPAPVLPPESKAEAAAVSESKPQPESPQKE
jgi:sec-independent protein translocase protein TatA